MGPITPGKAAIKEDLDASGRGPLTLARPPSYNGPPASRNPHAAVAGKEFMVNSNDTSDPGDRCLALCQCRAHPSRPFGRVYPDRYIWVRFQRLQAVIAASFICADDTHGTAIMIRARQEGRSEQSLIADMRAAHIRDFAGFDVEFDNYGSTNSPENRKLCGEFWAALRDAGLVNRRDVTQLYDPKAGVFLADRFVKGTCPKCGAADQYGDSCEKCQSIR